MEFFRWILVLAGVVLLGVAYLMGRRKVKTSVYHRAVPDAYDPSLDELSVPIGDISNSPQGFDDRNNLADEEDLEWGEERSDSDSHYRDNARYRSSESFLTDEEIDATLPSNESYDIDSVQVGLDISDDFDNTDSEANESIRKAPTSFATAVKQAAHMQELDPAETERNISEEFETYQEEPVQIEDFEEKLVTVHVVAQRDKRFFGGDLKALFDQHGYQFGRMSLYHCTLEGDRVFSIANMVKPGTFDEQALDQFATPGITLFMRLPIELDADVAFDFLIREAQELADELGGHLRDGNRNPLSEQTIQHMREDIQQYVFRTKRVLHTS